MAAVGSAALLGWGWRGLLVTALVLAAGGPALARQTGGDGRSEEGRTSRGEGGGEGQGEGGGGQEGGAGGGGSEEDKLPAPLGPLFERFDPARIQRGLDEALGLDTGDRSDKPRAPEIPLAIYRQTIRPLGGLKYENQPNYFVGTFGDLPSQQSFSYDYVFADWNAVRFEASWANADPQTVLLGYQRTLRVGERHNWVDGITFLPEYVVPTHFVGGSALYTLAWKPDEKSPWTFTPAVGVNRVDREVTAAGGGEGRVQGVWRPLLTLNAFYSFSRSFTVGVENDFLPSGRLAEYLVMPLATWRPTEHFFVQAGGGYYQLGSKGEPTFMCRVNLLYPSPRRGRD
jgi:hypothetical protein